MAYYLVRACLKPEFVEELRTRLKEKAFRRLQPFGEALTTSLENARWDPGTREVVWEEEDYCSPPLAMERAAVLDRYFDDLRVERVPQGEGWQRIADLPSLWEQDIALLEEPEVEVLRWDAEDAPLCDGTTGPCDVPGEEPERR